MTFKPVSITPTAKEIGSYPIAELSEKRAELVRKGHVVYDFGVGDDPLPIYSEVFETIKNKLPSSSQYPLVRGTPELRRAIANYFKRRFQVELNDNQILPVTGSKEGIYHLPGLFIDKNSERKLVLGPALAYPPYIKGTLAAGGEYIPLQGGPKENYLIELSSVSPDILSKACIIYLNYPHNPTGAGCDLKYYQRQVEVAKKYGILLVSDECYVDLYFGKAPPSLLEVTTSGVLAMHSLSKRSGMTGYRSGFVAGDAEYLDGYARLRNAIGTALPEPIALASIPAWEDDVHVEQRRFAFQAIRDSFRKFFDEIGLEYLKTDATFYMWAKAPNGHSGKSYANLLAEHGIFVAPADYFGPGSPEWFRVSLVLPIKECEKAYAIWRKIITS
jgi:LL-diaminopimelate aminotransferase